MYFKIGTNKKQLFSVLFVMAFFVRKDPAASKV